MSVPRSSEEFSNPSPDHCSCSNQDNNRLLSSTSISELEEAEEQQDTLCSSSSSSSPTSSECNNSELLVTSGSGSIVDDTDDLSSSFSSSQYNNSVSAAYSSSQRESWKSVPSGSEELGSDASCSSGLSSGSDLEINDSQLELDQCARSNKDSADEHELNSTTDGFETESEGESYLTVRNFSHTSPKEASGSNPKDKRSKGIYIHSASYYNRNQRSKRNLSINQEQRREIFAGRERNLQQSDGNRVGLLRRLDNYLHRMSVRVARYHKELCIVFLILASGLASLRTTPPKIRAVTTPAPFFEDKDTKYFLQDNFMGEYVDLANKQIPYHPSFLFYYAPWDSESVASKSVFLSVAKHFFFSYRGRVKFYGINCWWPGGQCRKNYKNLSHYPIFVAHIGKSAGIIYNGPIRAEPMIKFINSLLKPVTRIDTEDELWDFRAQHDVIMLGYFNFTMEESNEAYETYLQMALRTFEADPFNQVGFGLFLRPELAEKFFLTSSNAISLVLFNEIHTAKWHGGYHAQGLKGPVSQVADWIIERTKTVPLTWVYALRNGFANRPVALGPHDFAQQLAKGPVLLLVTRRYFPSGHSPFYMQVKEVALDYFNCNRSGNVTKLRRTTHKINSEWSSIWSSVMDVCQHGSFQCQQLLPNFRHWEKRRILFKREPLLRYENASAALNFTGLSCISERQFKFLAIDSVDVPYFIELGLQGLKSNEGYNKYELDPMAFIIDSQNDIILPLPSLNITDIAIAIQNYTSSVESGEFDTIPSKLLWSRNKNLRTIVNEVPHSNSNKHVTLKNWSSTDFIHYVNGTSSIQDSVLLVYTASFCGFCAIAVTHFVALSRFLQENYNNGQLKVALAKIDMFKNSLSPELSPEQLPTVVFIPSWNRSDIKMYPQSQEITSLGLLRFVLSELEPMERVQASLMSPSCGHENCISSRSQVVPNCNTSSSVLSRANLTVEDRISCIKSGRNSISSQIELLLQKIQNGEDAKFDSGVSPLNPMTTQYWNGQLLDRLRTMALTLEVS